MESLIEGYPFGFRLYSLYIELWTGLIYRKPFREIIHQADHMLALKADLHGTIFAYDCRMRFL